MNNATPPIRPRPIRGAPGPLGLAAALAASLGAAAPAWAQTTPTPTPAPARTAAGTVITNTATATYAAPGGGDASLQSNTVSLRVDELLDVAVASRDGGDVPVSPGATERVLAFTLTNAGNGSEAFRLVAQGAVAGDDFDPTVTSIVIDANGNGQYDRGVDEAYMAGGNDPVLAADGSVTVFVLSTIQAGATDGQRGQARLTATAATGSGAGGTVFQGRGQGGGDAVSGATTGSASADGRYVVTAATVRLVKSATVADPFGGTQPVPGAIVTYAIRAELTGSGGVAGLRIADAVPAGTSYRPDSLALDGVGLSDAADADAGSFADGAVAVAVGAVSPGGAAVVTFKVRID